MPESVCKRGTGIFPLSQPGHWSPQRLHNHRGRHCSQHHRASCRHSDPSFLKARTEARKNLCINNLRVIESAKEQWALTSGRSYGDPVDEAEVNTFIKEGRPTCPGAGVYTYNVVGGRPQCSLAAEGHVL